MGKYYKWKVLLIVVSVAASVYFAYPPHEKINLGLDLQGGMQMLLEVELDKVPEDARDDATERVVEIIRNRIDEFGVREPVISKQGSKFVVVQLPGVTDRERAKDVVGKTAHLEFKLVADQPDLVKQAEDGQVPQGYDWKTVVDGPGSNNLLMQSEAVLTGDHLTNAWVGFGQLGEANVQIQFDKDGAKSFDQITFQNVGRRLAIVLDGKVHSAPVIRDRIPNGQAVISGNFTPEEANDLSLVLRAGALPAPVKIIEERTVGPTLGQDSIEKGLKAGLIGTLLIFIFMPLYYTVCGLVADAALLLYGLILIGLMAAFHFSLTLPGIAGIILSLGMAVDANVLIFERMREEKEVGKTSRGAISAGYHKALAAILDSNITTLVTSLILFVFGTGPIKGFAVTLSIGILASMFSAVFVTRVIFDYLSRGSRDVSLKMSKMLGPTKINFLKGRFFAYGFSVLVLAIGIWTIFARGSENYGVEFTGGTTIQVQFSQSLETSVLREAIEKQGVQSLMLQRYSDLSDFQFLIKSSEPDTHRIEAACAALAGDAGYKVLKVDRVGPTVSADLTKKALWSVLWASLGILLYLGFRFEWKFALAAVVALLHDTIFTFGIYALSGREINLPIIAAVLTIMGYSVNDTIITFDRVRDNLKTMRRVPLTEIVNRSINQTLGRTLLTVFTTMLATLSLYLFGGPAIHDFAFVLLIGFGVGVYSTIFVANSLIVDWKVR